MFKTLFLTLLWVVLGAFTRPLSPLEPVPAAKMGGLKVLEGARSPLLPAVASPSLVSMAMSKGLALSEKLGLSADLLQKALVGFEKLKAAGKLHNTRLLTIADFSQASHQERLYIIDVEAETLVEQSLVAHGRNSGTVYAQRFSNKTSSYQSSLGFYVTGQPYWGKHGKSLVLEGMEKGINDKAQQRAIVLHGADYVSTDRIAEQGFIGRSQGCPAVPAAAATRIIDAIQGAACLFIYAPDKNYLRRSALLR